MFTINIHYDVIKNIISSILTLRQALPVHKMNFGNVFPTLIIAPARVQGYQQLVNPTFKYHLTQTL